jgi:hypothetical protein
MFVSVPTERWLRNRVGEASVRPRILETFSMSEQLLSPEDWKRNLGRRIAWTLAAKSAALLLLWFLFFRGAHS